MAKKFPFYRQLDSADCGPSCLRMICKFYGRSIELHKIREYCFANREGVSMLGISEGAERLGFRTAGIKTDFERFASKAILPCVIHWRSDHFCVVYKTKVKKRADGTYEGKVYVADPAFGLVSYSVEEFLDGWIHDVVESRDKGFFVQLVPTISFFNPGYAEQGGENFKLKYFFSYIKPYRKFFYQVILGLIVGMGFSFIMPFLTQSVVDVGILNSNLNFIYMIMVAQLIIALSGLAMSYIQSWILLHVTSRISISLISDFISKILRLPINFFESKRTGDIMQRIGDHSRIQTFFTATTISTLFSFVSFFVFAVIMAYYNKTMLIIFLIGHALYVGWVMLFLKIRRELDYKHFDKASSNKSSIIEIISGAEEIKLNNCENKMRNKWESIQAELFQIGIKGLTVGQIQSGGAFFLTNTTNIILSIMAATLVVNGNITLGMMMSLTYIIGQLKGPIGAFIGFVHSYQDAKISLERLGEIHLQGDEVEDGENKIREMPDTDRDLRMNNVTFSYNGINATPVLKNIDVTIPYNKVTAIVGESGSGKTTLLKLLLGYYDPLKGDICVGNINLKNMDMKFWRRQCGAVMQDGFIFSTSIAENIAISDELVDRQKLYESCVTANIHQEIEQMPAGYNTKIGAEGNGVSQGQKQRIQIARAVYKNPSFIFLDEATNSLDANNERIIIENLQQFYQGRTAVIVAHRLSTVKYADQIIVLSKGAVVEQGTHETLIGKQGYYYNLVKNQLEL